MDKELRSKVARVSDEFNSSEFFQFPRDRAGLAFQSTETNTMFVITAHLKGYTRGNVKVDLNEDKTKLVVTCEKPVQETVTIGSEVIKKGVQIRKFTESFKIPEGVIVDEIITNFNEETSNLTITMPKRMKEPELVTQTSSENLPYTVLKRARFQEDEGAADSVTAYRKGLIEQHGANNELPGRETKIGDDKVECRNLKDDEVCEKEEDKLPKRSKVCVPVIVGSAVMLSVVVFVILFMRKKKQPGKRKE
ncbi:uncharacterized protein [Solanum tuberosum]|uniref:Heat shock protein n=1 Tax=Solanum tuberosum TaxID=4113 RepID=M1AQH9_SOLTU|nr:PREDICTED: uncharacterized protein LOC102600776 [Solanum tuberosum]